MKRVWRVLRWLLLAIVILFVLAQFIRPARTNPTIEPSQSLEQFVQLDSDVSAILDRSCNDCHSNKTRWPWYSNVAPVSWFVIDHVNHGRSHLNFSEWGKYDERERRNNLSGICELARKGEMPLASYTPMHPGSSLTPTDISTICAWTEKQR